VLGAKNIPSLRRVTGEKPNALEKEKKGKKTMVL